MHRAGPAELAHRNRIAALESAKIEARNRELRSHGRGAKAASVAATEWVSLGPTDAPKEFNFFQEDGVDSGRPNSIVVDPRDSNVVYMAVSGGGVWKTFDLNAADGATWAPTTDSLPNLAVGALALDADHPDTLYMGNGDFTDASGNTMYKSTDGGGTWSEPVVLMGTYPDPGVPANVSSIRQIGVAGDNVFVATDAGLFQSTDAGATYALVDLPSADGKVVADAVWSVVPIGGGGWVAAGLDACDVGKPLLESRVGQDPSAACPRGTNAVIWRTDDGKTWSQVTPLPLATGTGRIAVASGATDDPAHTVVYAFVSDPGGSTTVGFWHSKDGGKTWSDATGTLSNPTLVAQNQDDSCIDTDVGHGQSWYNQAIVVDPTNPDHVLVGGNLCGMRTLDGTSDAPHWELVSHWLPGAGYGETANGRLPYVHADWHTATSVVVGDKVMTFAGTDGGIFASENVFDDATQAEKVVWKDHNRGLATHLFYAIASGDPVTSNPFVLFGGLQDNGTRFRADPKTPSAFNQPVGGDGIGGAVHVATSGTTYWTSSEFHRDFCKPSEGDCAIETPMATSCDDQHWHCFDTEAAATVTEKKVEEAEARAKRLSGEDSEPFIMRYANVETDTTGQSVITMSTDRVWVTEAATNANGKPSFTFKQISQDLTGDPNGAFFTNVTASRTIPGLYGAAGGVSIKPFYYTTTGNTQSVWKVTQPVHPDGTAARLLGPQSIDFPPVTPAGKQPGDVMIGAFAGPMNSAGRPPPPDDKGTLWRSTDGGTTWTSAIGADPAHRLPNVPVYVVKYDPVTPTTIYAGTDLGIYISTDDAATWNRMGDGFPVIPVRDIYVAKNQEFIRVATYGRGLWEIYPSATANQGSPGNGDYDRNLKLDWIDVAAMSSRLGVTPQATTAPLYSWIMDIIGTGTDPVQSIDESDFDALLAKFGGHP